MGQNIIVLDYASGLVTVYSNVDYEDAEEFLLSKEHRVNDCSWMSSNEPIEIIYE